MSFRLTRPLLGGTGLIGQVHGVTGLGGRSAFHPTKVAVFGAGGFLGRYTCNELGNMGVQVRGVVGFVGGEGRRWGLHTHCEGNK